MTSLALGNIIGLSGRFFAMVAEDAVPDAFLIIRKVVLPKIASFCMKQQTSPPLSAGANNDVFGGFLTEKR